jgi:hypothetical protein
VLGAFPALLMDQVKIVRVRLPVRDPLEQDALGNELVGGRNGIVAGTSNLPKAEFADLIFAQLKQADIRSGALIGIETGLDLGNRFHEIEIETERIGSTFDLLDGRPAGMSLSERRTVSAGFSAGGTSDQT